ncbi:hypothetical protein IWZ03DRAFT_51054 [Phyllosticta citriasiana]|uniref:Uncharacterized protein n=1 Tax=Phyllosticta citriasiana TaxID=595635 RepID=A0ABR1KC62_9PEZI
MLAFMSRPPYAAVAPPQDPPHAYAPTRSSPLTPRDPNAHLAPRPFPFAYTNSAMDAQPSQGVFGKPTAPARSTPLARREAKPNPLLQRSGSDAVRERRRDMFLRRVANDRDDRRWAARSEQILRLDYVQRQKRWEAEMARRAPKAAEPPSDEDDDDTDAMWEGQEDDVVASSQATNWSYQRPLSQQQRSESLEQEADVVAQQEDAELEALLDMMEEEEQGQDDDGPAFGSDDEYDHIFDEAFNAPPRSRHGPPQNTIHDNDDDMDMTG